MKVRSIIFFIALLFSAAAIHGQLPDKAAAKEALKKERAHIEEVLGAYTRCTFTDGLRISKVDRITKNKSQQLAREVGKGEVQPISRTDSYRVMVDYDKPDYFANIRPDHSEPGSYAADKEILIKWLSYVNTLGRLMDSRYPKETYYNGLEAYVINRGEIAGDSMGTALLFDDKNSIVTSIYFLNQREQYRNFKTIAEWRTLSERFLTTYSACIKQNLAAIPQ